MAHSDVKHPLQNVWTLWFDCQQSKKVSEAKWKEQVKKVLTYSCVEDFWGFAHLLVPDGCLIVFSSLISLYNNIQRASKLGVGASYHMFKEGIFPAWEDPENEKGGKWTLSLNSKKADEVEEAWLFIVSIHSSFL